MSPDDSGATKNMLDLEVFALRDNESIQLWTERPDAGRFLAVMARSLEMPEGPRSPVRHLDGTPVEQAAIVAAEWGHRGQSWQWVQMSPPTKERIGDLLFDSGAEKDRWYYLTITDLNADPDGKFAALRAQLAESRAEAERHLRHELFMAGHSCGIDMGVDLSAQELLDRIKAKLTEAARNAEAAEVLRVLEKNSWPPSNFKSMAALLHYARFAAKIAPAPVPAEQAETAGTKLPAGRELDEWLAVHVMRFKSRSGGEPSTKIVHAMTIADELFKRGWLLRLNRVEHGKWSKWASGFWKREENTLDYAFGNTPALAIARAAVKVMEFEQQQAASPPQQAKDHSE